MNSNIDDIERGLRIAIGLALIVLLSGAASWVLLLISMPPLLTGLVGWCPHYALLGFSTKPFSAAADFRGTASRPIKM